MNLKAIAIALSGLAGVVFAQNYDTVVKQSTGTYYVSSDHTVGTSNATIQPADVKRVALMCKNNTAGTIVYFGANDADLTATGFPISHLETISLGANSDAVYARSDTADTEVRCLEGLIR